MKVISIPERVAGGIYGLLIGDAAGVPVEFRPPAKLPSPLNVTELLHGKVYTDQARSHPSAPKGAWSDDGAQALCFLESLLIHDDFVIEDVADRLLRWQTKGHMAVGEIVFDIGSTTSSALMNLRRGVPAHASGLTAINSNGNGSLMRTLPAALWTAANDDPAPVAARIAADASSITHRHDLSRACCAVYAAWARLEAEAMPFHDGDDGLLGTALRTCMRNMPALQDQFEHINSVLFGDAAPDAHGYVLGSLQIAAIVMRTTKTFGDAIAAAIGYGFDTDTNAAIVGGLAGIRFGLNGIPLSWREGMPLSQRERAVINGLVSRARRERHR